MSRNIVVRLRRAAVLSVLLAGTLSCSPAQVQEWMKWHSQDPEAAEQWAANECGALCTDDWDHDGVVEPEPSAESASSTGDGDYDSSGDGQDGEDAYDGAHEQGYGQCAEWFGTAISAGWSESDWPTVDRLMYAESGCDPGAYNSASGVTGLMQIMQFWAEDCGGSPSDLYDPWFNLSCALHVKNVQGWEAWVTF